MSEIPEFQVRLKKPGLRIVKEDLSFANQKLTSMTYENLKLGMLSVENCEFINCTFRDVKADTAYFGGGRKQSKYQSCLFENFDFRSTASGNVLFENCNFKNILAREFHCYQIEFINCSFSGRIKKGYFNKFLPYNLETNNRTENRLIGNDFSEVIFDDFGFRGGVDLESQKLPVDNNGFVFVKNGRIFLESMKKEADSIPNLQLRNDVKKLIDIFMYDVDEGQDQLYFSINGVPKKLVGAFQWIFNGI